VTSDAGPDDLPGLLRSLRIAAGLSQPEVARRTGLSQARVSRAENGRSILGPDEVAELAALYGAGADQRDRLVRMAAEAEQSYVDARTVIQRGNTARLQDRFAALEAGAVTVRSFQPVMVLGVLQSSAYAAAVFGTAEDDPLVAERLARTECLLAEPGRRWVLVQTEGSLRWLVGSARLMAAQIRRIRDVVAGRPNVEFGLISWQTPVDVLPPTAFHLYDSSTVVVGTSIGSAFIDDTASMDLYREQFDRLARLAVFGDAALAGLDAVAADYDNLP
jgi:transcriptional regulator with XRE-family HTH domain